MKKTIIIIINILIITVFVMLLIFNFIFFESGYTISPVTDVDGQSGMGVMFHVISRFAGIICAVIIFALVLIKRLLILKTQKFEFIILIISAVLSFFDFFIVES